jgi:hypothetical protein
MGRFFQFLSMAVGPSVQIIRAKRLLLSAGEMLRGESFHAIGSECHVLQEENGSDLAYVKHVACMSHHLVTRIRLATSVQN